MKKNILTILFIALFFTSFSQDKELKTQHYLGIFAGGGNSNLNLIYSDPDKTLNIKNPYVISSNFGLSYKRFSKKNIGLAIDIKYIKKGGYSEFNVNYEGEILDSAVQYKYIPEYIELTPLMNLSLGKKRTHLNVFFGPHISYLLNDKVKILSETSNIYKTSADKKIELGLDLGTGLDFEFFKNDVELRVFYSFGLTNMFNANETYNNLWFIQNRVILASLYYYYKI